jgi:hypothetical protein
MEDTTEKKPYGRGGYRPGAGRKTGYRKPPEEKSVSKSVSLTPGEWKDLEAHSTRVGAQSVTKFAAQLLRQYLHQNAPKLDRFNS